MVLGNQSLKGGHASKAAEIARGAGKRTASSACGFDKEGDDLRKIGGSGATSKNSMRDVLRSMSRLGYTVSVPISWVPTVYANDNKVEHVEHPVLGLMDMLTFMLNNYSFLLLGGHALEDPSGNWKTVLQQFWQRFEWHDPTHPIFRDVTRRERSYCIPLMVYGDEGTGKRRMPVWLLCWKPVLFAATDSYHRTLLYTCANHTTYSAFHCGMDAGNECLDPLVRAFADEAQKAYTEGNLVATSPLSLPIPLSLSLSLSIYVSLSLYIYMSLSLSRSLSFFDKLGRANSLIRFAPVLIRVSWPTVQYVTFISTNPMYIYI